MLTETGIKALGAGIPSEAELRRLDRAVDIIRVRYQRWARARWSAILRGIRDEILSLEDPDDADFIAAVMRRDPEEESALIRVIGQVYPAAVSLVTPDDVIKRMTALEMKAEDARIWDLISRLVGREIQRIDHTTLSAIRTAYIQADGDVEKFRKLILESSAFSPARARTIAVTETNTAINDAIYRASDEVAGERERIMVWRTTMRLNVREFHKVMEGKTVPYGEFFHVPNASGGFDLMLYPGDSLHGAGPENIINCFCKGFPRYVARDLRRI
ncbi:MAG: hypothetical protein J5494_01645 [Candidatus Methanomethylophilaceae archaeon]|nr:hypothetical protein [Candidatus Methanomethylophilaceae archaeon]